MGEDWSDDDDLSDSAEASEASTAPDSSDNDEMEHNNGSESSEDVEGADDIGDDGAGAAASAVAAEPELPATQAELAERRQHNIQALVTGTGLALQRAALMPRLGLTVQQVAVVLRRPFKSPHPNAPAVSAALKRKLAARKSFVPWGGGVFVPLKLKAPPRTDDLLLEDAAAAVAAPPPPAAIVLPPGVTPLVLWEPPPEAAAEGAECVRVDDMLTQWLRPHQREGVQFMFECVTGLRSFGGQGCILADDMGLGKTLQGISLLWTLLSSKGHPLLGGDPLAKRVIICCPTSLVGNWDSECQKWLKGRVRTLPLCESSRDEALASITQFLSPRCPFQVMIVSYETFRIHAERFRAEGTCDLLICDEAHRLKNDSTLTNRALDSLACRRRVLLSGTPLQNRLDEFYAMVSFCNPGVLGSPSQFRKHFESPILAGREPDASEAEVAVCQQRTTELSALVNHFILRRTNTLLSEHLPPKVVEIVCCRLTPLQRSLYLHFLESKAAAALFATQKAARVLSAITSLRKLLNHPKLIWDVLNSHAQGKGGGKEAAGFEGCASFFPAGAFGSARTGRGGGGMAPGWELLSGKFAVLAGMLELLRSCTTDRIVVVSNYTQTLDLVGQLCRDRGYPFVRLDGTTSIKKRNALVKDFNDPAQSQFAFLLSSKAGGCGLNLIGGNRLVLFDPSWNPADDKQAAARVWRDGQTKKVYVYRFMAAGSIEEKVYQRQLSKEGLQQVVDSKAGGKAGPNLMSINQLRDLFTYDPHTLSSTYDQMCCECPPAPPPQPGGAKAGKAGKAGKKAGGKAAGRGGRQPAKASGGGQNKRQKKAAARRGWSSSSDDSDGGDGGLATSEEEESDWEQWGDDVAVAGGAAGGPAKAAGSGGGGGHRSEILISDSEEEREIEEQGAIQAQAAAARQAQQAAAPLQQRRHCGGAGLEHSDDWSSEEDAAGGSSDGGGGSDGGGSGAAMMVPACQGEGAQVHGLPATQPLQQEQAGAQQQQQQQGAEQDSGTAGASAPSAAAGGGDAAAVPAPQERRMLVPTGQLQGLGLSIHNEQVGKPSEEQLRLWAHHSDTATVPDQVLRRIGGEHVSFVFSLEVEGRAVDPEPPLQLLPKAPAHHHQLAAGRQQRRLPGPASHTSQPALAAAASGTSRSAGPLSAAAAASAMLAARRLEAAPAAALPAAGPPPPLPPPPQQQQQQQQQQAAKENAGTNVVEAPRSRLALPRSKPASGAAAGAAAKRAVARHPAGLAAAAQRAVCTILDSDDDSI